MSYGDALRQLIEPLGVYRLRDSLNGGELEVIGAALDACGGELETLQREMLLSTAETWGLERVEQLFRRKPVTANPVRRREALAALLRVGGDSFTLAAINDNLKGCGLNAVASETATTGRVEVRFPEVPGIPDGFEEMRKIIEDILPCHLEVVYVYWYITWTVIEARFATWGAVESLRLTWGELEKQAE